MVHEVADEGNGLQVWRIIANILNKQLQAATRGGPPDLGLDMGLITYLKEISILQNVTQGLGLGQSLWNGTSSRKGT
jgi:hypothetical protein